MEQIKIDRTTFSAEDLRTLTIDEAKAKYDFIDSRIVSTAWHIANKNYKPEMKPEPKKKRTKKK